MLRAQCGQLAEINYLRPPGQVPPHSQRDSIQCPVAIKLYGPNACRRIEAFVDHFGCRQCCRQIDPMRRQSVNVHVVLPISSNLNHRIFMPAKSTNDATSTRDPAALCGSCIRCNVSSPPKKATLTSPPRLTKASKLSRL